MRTLLVASTHRELQSLRSLRPDLDTHAVGVGKAACAFRLTQLIGETAPDLIIMIGCAGGFASRSVKMGDVVLATREIFADEGVETPEGFESLDEIGLALVDGPNSSGCEIQIPPTGIQANDLCQKSDAFAVHQGSCITVSRVTGTVASREAHEARYAALAESMEGAAAALVCQQTSTAFLELRGISNFVGPRDRDAWDIDTACTHSAIVAARALDALSSRNTEDS